MDFKIKYKGKLKFIIYLGLVLVTIGGITIGLSCSDDSIKLLYGFIVGAAMVIVGIICIVTFMNSVSRSDVEIDIDSFTEAAIEEEIEKRWNKIKEEVRKSESLKKVS